MKGIDEVIGEHPFFATLPPEHRAVVAGCARLSAFKAGSYLCRAGAEADSFFLVRRGAVALELKPPGGAPFLFQTLGPGEILGWSWLFAPYTWQFDARAVDDTSVVQFDGRCLRGKCDADTRLGYDLMKRFAQMIIQRFVDTRLQLIDVYANRGA